MCTICLCDVFYGEYWFCRPQILAHLQDPETLYRIQGRMEKLQDYLISYSDCGVPVFSTSLRNMKATINQLHDYLLECIALQMCAKDPGISSS